MNDAIAIVETAVSAPPAPPPSEVVRVGPLQRGLAAARANMLPGVILTAIGLAVVLGYYFHPPTHAVLERIAAFRQHGGLMFSAISTALFGGLMPVLIQQVVPNLTHRAKLRHLPFFLLFWAYRGFETDLFYRLQVVIFGETVTLQTVLSKLLVDMLLYTPLWAVPSMVLPYLWKDSGFSATTARRRLGSQWYRTRVLPVLISNIAIWLPAVTILYSLPSALQMPFQNLVLCLSTLILTLVMASHEQHE